MNAEPIWAVHERRPVPAGLRPLQDQHVSSGRLGLAGFLGTGDGDPHLRAGGAEGLDHGAVGTPERERDRGHGLARQQLQLRVPVVIAVPRLADLAAGRP
jgi:hypothetical protein